MRAWNACPQSASRRIQKDKITAFIAYNCPKIGPLSMGNAKVQCSKGDQQHRITRGGRSFARQHVSKAPWQSSKSWSKRIRRWRNWNAVANAASIWSVMYRLFPCYQNFDSLATFIRANSFSLFLQSRKPSLISLSISEFKKRMKHYGYANNMVLPSSKHNHLGNPDMFVSAPSSHF